MPRHFTLGPRPWGELVFHVLAHVRPPGAVPASVWDPAYVAFAEEALGPASSRYLAADAANLERLVAEHEKLASVQRLAWLFVDLERARAASDRDLASLRPEDVDAPELLPPLVAEGPVVEVLRAAAELERPAFDGLPALKFDRQRLALGLEQAIDVAPELAQMDVAVVRSLGVHGRAGRGEVWIGAPVERGKPNQSHVVWQASHEASVFELSRLSRELGVGLAERELERSALVLLGERAEAKARTSEFLRWFGATPPSSAALPGPAQALVATARRSAT